MDDIWMEKDKIYQQHEGDTLRFATWIRLKQCETLAELHHVRDSLLDRTNEDLDFLYRIRKIDMLLERVQDIDEYPEILTYVEECEAPGPSLKPKLKDRYWRVMMQFASTAVDQAQERYRSRSEMDAPTDIIVKETLWKLQQIRARFDDSDVQAIDGLAEVRVSLDNEIDRWKSLIPATSFKELRERSESSLIKLIGSRPRRIKVLGLMLVIGMLLGTMLAVFVDVAALFST